MRISLEFQVRQSNLEWVWGEINAAEPAGQHLRHQSRGHDGWNSSAVIVRSSEEAGCDDVPPNVRTSTRT